MSTLLLNQMPITAAILIFGGFGLMIVFLNHLSDRSCCGEDNRAGDHKDVQ